MSTHRVLIVEDHPDTRELLCEQLADQGFELVLAGNGQEAILKVGERAPDLVLMDVMMPQLNGFETSRYLKLRYRKRFLPIAILSAKSDRASREQGARFGCDDYRGKPYTKQQLLVSISSLLRLGQLENALRDQSDDDLRRQLIDARYELAKRLVAEQSYGIARSHIERIYELTPDHEGAASLLAQIEAQATPA